MRRRDFLSSLAIGGTLAGTAEIAFGQSTAIQRPPGFGNRIIAIGRGVFAEPKYPVGKEAHQSKVPGTMVCLTATPFNNVAPFLVSVFAQFRSHNSDRWAYVRCKSTYKRWYEWQNALRDI